MSSRKEYFPRSYLTLLGLVALVIVTQSAIFLQREYRNFELISRENIRQEGLRLAGEIGERIKQSAGACLKDWKLLTETMRVSGDGDLNSAEFDNEIRKISEKHPIAGQFFMLADGRLIYPRQATEENSRNFDAINAYQGKIPGDSWLRRIEEELKAAGANGFEDARHLFIGGQNENRGGMQLYYAGSREKDSQWIWAISINQQWIEDGSLLHEALQKMNSGFSVVRLFTIRQKVDSGSPDISIPFREVTSLELWLAEGAISNNRLSYKIWLIVLGLTAISALALLVTIMLSIRRITMARMAIKIKSDFLRHTSHELRTPLTIISLYAENLLADENMSEEDRRYSLEVISRESEHLLGLSEFLLNYSSETGKNREQFIITEDNLETVVEKNAPVYAEWLKKHGLELRVMIEPDLPPVCFDREKITIAFRNLLDNARKYGKGAGLIEVMCYREKDRVVLAVRDHGPGIPEPERKEVFKMFFRGANAPGSRGVGLGLFIVNETMKAHDGSVELETTPGGGATFRLVFPLRTATGAPASTWERRRPAGVF